VGRHSGAVCKACQRRILVRDGRLIEHWHQFATLGKSLLASVRTARHLTTGPGTDR